MKMPFDFIRLYRKDGIIEEQACETDCGIDLFNQYDATIDLFEVQCIEACYIDKQRVTALRMFNGDHIIALVNIKTMREQLRKARIEFENKNLLTNKQ